MHIGIEAHGFWGQPEGQARAIYELILGLSRLDTENQYTLFLNAMRDRQGRIEAVRRKLRNSQFNVRLLPLPNVPHPATLFLRERVVWPWITRRLGVDVFHATSYRGTFGPRMRTVLTIHDFAYHVHPEVFTGNSLVYYRHLARDAARAAIVVTVSEHTKRDAMRILGVPESKIRVVPNGVDLDRFRPDLSTEEIERVRVRYGLRGRIVLTVGNMNPKKNIVRLVQAFARLRARISEVQLVLIGKATGYGPVIEEQIDALGLRAHVQCTGYVPDADLPALYRAAEVFVFPSLFEGFGMPVLEAMACGTPVVASNVTALPEVAGDAALLVDPLNVGQLADVIADVLDHRTVHAELVKRGLRQACNFSWEQTAQQALNVYREAYEHATN